MSKSGTASRPAAAKNKVFSVAKRHSDPAHEALLLLLKSQLPQLLRQELQTAEPLNRYVMERGARWNEKVELLIKKKKMPDAQADIWRKVSNLSFADPRLDTARITFGETLTEFSQRTRTSTPVMTCDFAVNVEVPYWDGIYLCDGSETSFPDKPISKPIEGVSFDTCHRTLQVFGQVFPTGCALGEVAIEMARLTDAAGKFVSFTSHYQINNAKEHVLLVTDNRVIFDALADQYDAVLFESDSKEIDCAIEYLKRANFAQ